MQTQSNQDMSLINKTIQSLKKIRRYAVYTFEKSKFPKPDLSKDNQFPEIKFLRDEGYVYVQPQDALAKIPVTKKLLDSYQKIDPQTLQEMMSPEARTFESGYRKSLTPFFNQADLLEYAQDPFFMKGIEQYFGFKPHIRYIGGWLDYPNDRKDAFSTQMHHRDPEDHYLIKTFFYLKDVAEENGTFCFVTKSHKDSWNSYSKIVHTDEEIAKLYPNSEVKKLAGPAGSLVLADPNGFHKGLKPQKGYRALITVYYCSDKPRIRNLENIFDPQEAVPLLY